MTMRKKVLIATFVAILLLAGAVAAALSFVFRVSAVRANFHVFSNEGRAEAVALQEELDSFIGKNTTFLKLSEVEERVKAYPSFRVTHTEKKYPNVVEIEIHERREAFALQTATGYQIFDEDGIYLYDKQENVNRAGGENILLLVEGSATQDLFVSAIATGETAAVGYFGEAVRAYQAFAQILTEVRTNVHAIALGCIGNTALSRNFYLRFAMAEGMDIMIINPSCKAAEKATATAQAYLALEDGQRLKGEISITDIESTGEITVPDYNDVG